jgi:hypothetical protein
MKLFCIGFFVASFVLSSCTPKIKPFLWLTGTWEMKRSAGGSRMEIWTQTNNESMTGKGIRIEGPDTFLLEKVELISKNDGVWYIATVPDQNNSLPIEFKLVKSEGTVYTFENAKHDFPQRISYRYIPADKNANQDLIPGDSLLVRVESLDGNGIDFGFARR